MTATRPGLRAVIREIVAGCDSPDPHVMAKLVLDSLTADECREALALTLPEYLRTFVGFASRRARADVSAAPSKADRSREWWQKVIASPAFTGTEWKYFGDFTRTDVRGAAEERFRAAAATRAEGKHLLGLAKVMDRLHVDVVRDIPPDTLKSALGKAPA